MAEKNTLIKGQLALLIALSKDLDLFGGCSYGF